MRRQIVYIAIAALGLVAAAIIASRNCAPSEGGITIGFMLVAGCR
jgi:hypothetical protein